MTLLEKIKNYKWFDSPNKLRAILEELYNSIGGGSGGGAQNLQSVLDNGNEVVGYNYIKIKEFPSMVDEYYEYYQDTSLFQLLSTSPDGSKQAAVSITTDNENVSDPTSIRFCSINMQFGDIGSTIRTNPDSTFSRVFLLPKITTENLFPQTIATTDDIKKIDLTGRIYADNAAAISGGLTVNDVYRTSTGELRIVV